MIRCPEVARPDAGRVLIYRIICEAADGMSYIGITKLCLRRRMSDHKTKMKRFDYPLYQAMRAHGEASFYAEHLATAFSWKDACALEAYFIKEFDTHAPNGYNLTVGGQGAPGYSGIKGQVWTEERRRNLSIARTGMKFSAEHRAAIGAETRRRHQDPEYKRRAVAALLSAPLTKEQHRQKGLRHRGYKATPEARKNYSEAAKRRVATAEGKAQLEAAIAGSLASKRKDDAWKEKIRQTLTGRKLPPQHCANVANALRGRKRSPEECAAISAGQQRRRQRRLEAIL